MAENTAAEVLPEGFVRVSDVVPGVLLDVKYVSAQNFTGERVEGYEAHTAILTGEAADALKKAAVSLARQGYRIKVFDAYRPQRAVDRFVRWAEDLGDQRMKPLFYPEVEKADLYRLGYISGRSAHARGCVVDLTLVDARTGAELDMGTKFDLFGPASHYESKRLTAEQARNRKILRDAMAAAGFRGISSEWWHYVLVNETRRDRYHDFPVDLYEDAARRVTAEAVAGLAVAESCSRLVVVVPLSPSPEDARAFVLAFERRGNGWISVLRSEGHVGYGGVAYPRHEGSGATPLGAYSFGRAFGVADDPGSRTPYTKLAPGDLWVDDPHSRFYNRWARADDPNRDWESAEDLFAQKVAYRYAIAIGYNVDPVLPGAGSAIFLHCTTGRPTAGCISVPEEAMKQLLRFISDDTRIVVASSAEALMRY